jgi:Ca2+/H+ antiporter, TMEM165/GDT1 family
MWEYLTVFVLAATPLVELLVVIPLGIGYGLQPAAVALVTMVGNLLPVLAIVMAYDRWRAWRRRRAMRAGRAGTARESEAGSSVRWQRAGRLWARYGTAGLALLAPLLTGVHLATVVALALGSPRRAVAGWMAAAIVVWTLGVTLATLAGIEGVRHIAS